MTEELTDARPRRGQSPPDRFIGGPLLAAAIIWLLTFGWLILGWLSGHFGFFLLGLFFGALAIPIAAIVWLVSLVITGVRWRWRKAISIALAGFGFAGAAVLTVLNEESLRAPIWTVAVASPSGRHVAEKRFFNDDEPRYAVFVATRDILWRQSKRLISGRKSTGFGIAGDLTVAWDSDRRLIIGWPIGTPPESGPARIGDVEVRYASYAANPMQDTSQHWRELPLQHVNYSFREEQPQPLERRCVVRLTGTDGAVFDNVSAEITGKGFGEKTDKPHIGGSVASAFSLTRLSDGKSPPLTLTQAMIGAVFPVDMLNSGPQNAELSLLYLAYRPREITQLFQTMYRGDFILRFVLSFGEQQLAYRVQEPLPREIVDKFNDCAAMTNILGTPVSTGID